MSDGPIIYFQDSEKMEHFFSTRYQQPNVEERFIANAIFIPQPVAPREGFSKLLVETKEDVAIIYLKGSTEIPNPDPAFQA